MIFIVHVLLQFIKQNNNNNNNNNMEKY